MRKSPRMGQVLFSIWASTVTFGIPSATATIAMEVSGIAELPSQPVELAPTEVITSPSRSPDLIEASPRSRVSSLSPVAGLDAEQADAEQADFSATQRLDVSPVVPVVPPSTRRSELIATDHTAADLQSGEALTVSVEDLMLTPPTTPSPLGPRTVSDVQFSPMPEFDRVPLQAVVAMPSGAIPSSDDGFEFDFSELGTEPQVVGQVDADVTAEPPPFVFPPREPGFVPSRALHCDALEHLKTPRTYRRLDSYMRPSAFLPRGREDRFLERDYFLGNWGGVRDQLYASGIEFYGCAGFDFAYDVVSNTVDDNPNIINGETSDWQINYTQVYGLDIYSRLLDDDWQGGQLHISVTWPESDPLSFNRNNLNFNGSSQFQGHFYTDVTVLRSDNYKDQGIRLFELWFQQRYGPNQQSYVRIGNIFPMITFNRSILSGMFNFWTFHEPCMLGTVYIIGNAPCYPVAPLGLQVYHVFDDNIDIQFQVQQGYYDATGRRNTRGLYWDLRPENGIEAIAELTYRGGTYSFDPEDNSLPWYMKIGGQIHTGLIYDNYFNDQGESIILNGGRPREHRGNAQIYVSYEGMLFREPGSYGEGLTMFAKAGTGFFDDRNGVRAWMTAGFGYEGLFGGRDRDVLYAGWGRLWATDGILARQRDSQPCRLIDSCNLTGAQDIFEVGYSMELTPWFWFTPMCQLLVNPNTRSDLGNILTCGAATRLSF